MPRAIVQDVTYALRTLRKAPAFSAPAILSLALGIGTNTTIFTIVNAVLLRPLPYPEADRIVVLREQPTGSGRTVHVHPFNFFQWRARAQSFESMTLVQAPPLNVLGANGPEQIARLQATVELFPVFGVEPILGRPFTSEEMQPGHAGVVILGHGFWQRWFGGDPSVIGRQLIGPESALTIVGVAPPAFHIGTVEPDAITPLAIDPANAGAVGGRSFQCYGRLKPAATVDQARSEMDVIASALAREFPLDRGMGVYLTGLHQYLVHDVRSPLQILMGAVAMVLAIACANIAGLLMARGVTRRGEFAVRASLGASRGRLISQLIVESLVLALIGGAVGLLFAHWTTQGLVNLATGALSTATIGPITLDWVCFVFAFAMTVVTALISGLVPAWHASRIDPQMALRQHAQSVTADRHHHRMRRTLVIAEVALAVMLLVGAGLLLRTFSSLVRVDVGFQPSRTLAMGLFLGVRPPDARVAALDRILERVAGVPDVVAAGTIQFLPLSGAACGTAFRREGEATGDPSTALPTECSLVSRGYFAAMSIPLLQGRGFDEHDRLGSPRVVIVNRAFARRYFPDGRVVGRRILVDWSDAALADIVGVVGDVRHNGLTSEPAPTVFLLHAQTPGYITNLVVRTRGDALAQTAAVRRAIHDADPTQAVSSARTMEQYVGDALSRPRLYAALVGSFAALAVILATIGIYGLIAYIVSQRTHEIGIRLALGASRERIFIDHFGEGARLVAAGTLLGIGTAAGLRDVLSALLFGVAPGDPISYATAAGAAIALALAAVALPAHRAARVEPTAALRQS